MFFGGFGSVPEGGVGQGGTRRYREDSFEGSGAEVRDGVGWQHRLREESRLRGGQDGGVVAMDGGDSDGKDGSPRLCAEVIVCDERCDSGVQFGPESIGRSRSARVSASDGDTELDGVQRLIAFLGETFRDEFDGSRTISVDSSVRVVPASDDSRDGPVVFIPRVEPSEVVSRVVTADCLGFDPQFKSPRGVTGPHALQAESSPLGGESCGGRSICPDEAARSHVGEGGRALSTRSAMSGSARVRSDHSIAHVSGSTPDHEGAADLCLSPVAPSLDGSVLRLDPAAGRRFETTPSVLQVEPVERGRITTVNLRGDPVAELRLANASVVGQLATASGVTESSSSVSDGKPSASPDAEGPEPDVDRSVERRRSLHRLHAQPLLCADHTDGAVAASAAGSVLAVNRVFERDDVVMTEAEGAMASVDAKKCGEIDVDMVERDGVAGGSQGADGFVDTIKESVLCGEPGSALPYMDEVLYFEAQAFRLKEVFLLFYAAQRAEQRVIRAVALSLKSPESVQMWMERLEVAVRAKGVAENVVKVFVGDGIDIWDAAVAAQRLWIALSALQAQERVAGAGRDGCGDEKEARVLEPEVEADAMVKQVEPKVRAVVAIKPPGIMMQTVAYVAGKPETVFNDSGADVSCVSSATVKRLGLVVEATTVAVYNPNGVPFKMMGVTVIPLKFGNREFKFPFQVIEDLDVGILIGDDFLRHYKCTLSYGSGFVEYDGVPVSTVQPLESKSTLRMYRATEGLCVELAENTVVAVGKAVDMFGRVRLPDGFRYGQHVWTFEPLMTTEAALGVAFVPAVVKLEGADSVRVRVVRREGAPTTIILPAGTVVGRIHTLRSNRKNLEEIRVIRALSTLAAGPGRAEVTEVDTKIIANSVDIENVSVVEATQADVGASGEGWTVEHEEAFQGELRRILKQMPAELTAEERQAMADVLTQYKQMLNPVRLGCAKGVIVDIDPGVARPVCHPDRRWSPQESRAIREQVDALLAAGLVEPSDSPWSNRLVCAPKKGSDGTKSEIRVCVDFRDVNALCVKDAYPAPNVEATLDQLNKAAWYSSVDLAKGYHQVPLSERAKQICSFRCPSGFFRYTRMPFGIMNAPAVFQRMMDVVLRDIAWKFCMVYVDDVIIYSTSWSDHVDHVAHVLRRIRDAGLTVGLKKCHFGGREVAFLGYVVSAKGIKPDPAKVAAVRAFQIPATLPELRSFLGLASQFRKFIRSFGDMARPLQYLTRKEAHGLWVAGRAWTEERVLAFEAIKACVTEEVTLAHPRYDKPLLVVCDASDYGMGAMLAQLDDAGNERPIAFTSATFYGPALRYTTTEKEGLAVVWAAAHFRPYIHGIPTVVVTDHAALTWILARGDPPARIAHWVMDLAQYDFTYVHRKGAHNNVADALSRLQGIMDAVERVDGSAEMPTSCVIRGVTTRRKKKSLGVQNVDEAPSEDVPMVSQPVVALQDKNSVPAIEGSSQPTRPGNVVHHRDGTCVDTCDVGFEGVEGVGCNRGGGDCAPSAAGADTPKEVPKPKTTDKSQMRQEPGFWVEEATSDGVRLGTEFTAEEIISAQLRDTELRAMRGYIQNGIVPDDTTLRAWVMSRSDEFLLQTGVLMKAEHLRVMGRRSVRLTLAVPKELKWKVVAACHDSAAFGGHMDAARTCARVKRHFWWGRVYSDVYDYVGGCLTCRSAAKRTAGPAPVSLHSVPTRPFEYMGIDLIAMPESASGNKYAMVVMDHFSRYATVVPVPDKSATTVARALVRYVVLVHGPPKSLLSDQGGEFDNELMKELARSFGYKKLSTTPYRPQCDGLVERFNRTLLRLLRCFVDTSQLNWDDVLPYVLFAYNTAVSSTTGEAPFSIVFGREPPAPIFAGVLDDVGVVRKCVDPAGWRREVQQVLSEEFMGELAAMNRDGKVKRNDAVNAGRAIRNVFRPGLVVLVANNQKVVDGGRPKLARKQRGLFVVVSMVTAVTAKLRKVGDAKRALSRVHVDQLEPVRTAGNKVLVLSSPFPPDVCAEDRLQDDGDEGSTDEATTEDFEVAKVSGIRLKEGQLQLKVSWKGYDAAEDSWLAECDLDCPRLVEDFVAYSGEKLARVFA